MQKLTIKEAAEYYGKSDSWIRKRILAEELEAEKESFTYGKRWVTTKEALDDLAERLRENAVKENEIIEVRNVDRKVSKEEFLNELEEMNRNLLENATNELKEKIDDQNKLIKELQNEIRNKKSYLDQFIDFIKSKF